MKKVALVTTRGYKANYDSLYIQMNILKDYEVHLYHKYKTEKIKDHIESVSGIRIAKSFSVAPELKKATDGLYESWRELYDSLDFDEDYDEVWLFGSVLSSGARLKRRITGTYDKIFEVKKYMTFHTCARMFIDIYVTAKLASRSPILREICYDPGEASISDFKLCSHAITYHGYDIDHLGIRRLDSFQQGLKATSKNTLFDHEKTLDFCFGYSYMTKEREEVHNNIQSLYNNIDQKFTKKLFVKSKMTNEYSDIEYSDYLSEIKISKFTLIVPAYEDKCFSCYRFIESVFNDCLPLIHKSCYTDEFIKSYDIEKSFIESLYVDERDINNNMNMSETERLEKLSYLKKRIFDGSSSI